ncbi:hypothetical protein [Agromyces aureus]|uniref:Uncharacterized protein n=1 Tax=Agromyces aureus TaxID=453304 RepID=A0A191WEU8_9MICO|nr:hypothetical protein [Agromyces aureus]ANJ26800.1 hypothetical protein ATC03_08810 [Agromyces aureus]
MSGVVFHCAELHERIAELLRMLGKERGLTLTECSRCGGLIVAHVEGNDERNEAMEICGACGLAVNGESRADAIDASADWLEAIRHETWNGGQRRPSNYRAAAADLRGHANDIREGRS